MTIFIIVVLMFLFLLGLAIPQKALYRSNEQYEHWKSDHPVISGLIISLGLNNIYVAPVTVFFLCLFFVNLIVVLGHRVPVVLRRAYLLGRKEALAGVEKTEATSGARALEVDGCGADVSAKGLGTELSGMLKKRWWFVIGPNEAGALIAVKNRFSPLGFILFHLSFLLCLAGGLLVMYTRFSGNLVLTEGQEFYSDIRQFRLIKNYPKLFHSLPELGIILTRVIPHYERGAGTDLTVSAKIRYFSDVSDEVVRVNEPIKKGAVSILASDVGYSPLMLLRDRDGREIQSDYFSLKVDNGREDSLSFQRLPYKVFVRFYPDYAEVQGKAVTRSRDLRNPAMRMRIEKSGKVLFDGIRRQGQPAEFDSYSLTFGDVRYWVDFFVVREYGSSLLFIGFFCGIAGLIMRLVFFQKVLRVKVDVDSRHRRIYISGRSEYYQQTFKEEFDRLVADLEKDLVPEMAGAHR